MKFTLFLLGFVGFAVMASGQQHAAARQYTPSSRQHTPSSRKPSASANAHTSLTDTVGAWERIPTVAIDSFTQPITTQGLLHMLGHSTLIDSIGSAAQAELLFAPLRLAGVTAIGKISFRSDTVVRSEFFLPYHPHGTHKPVEPYADQGFVHATIDNMDKLLAAFVRLFGEPSVAAETVFEYFSRPGVPAIRAQFHDRVITVTIVQQGIL